MAHNLPVAGLPYFMQQLSENGYLKVYFRIAISIIIASVFFNDSGSSISSRIPY